MCTLGEKPIFAHIIDLFDIDDEIIIPIGYKGKLLKEVIEVYYPERNITFVEVDDYSGLKAGLGYSLSKAKEYLQKPFIIWACDTVFNIESFDMLEVASDVNQMILSKTSKVYSELYRHAKVDKSGKKIIQVLPKDPDYPEDICAYTGVSYIYDWKLFWEKAYENFERFTVAGESYCLSVFSTEIDAVFIDNSKWIDTGNRIIFERAKKYYANKMQATVLEKPEESIWFKGNKVIKFHIDEKFISDRCKRYNILSTKNNSKILFPKVLSQSPHTYTYEYTDGIIASSIINEVIFKDIIDSWFSNIDFINIPNEQKINIYNDFYKERTISRIEKYCQLYGDIDNECIINGIECLPASYLIENINWENLALNGMFTNNYHGDFHLENILVNNDKYILLDWRQNFGKSMTGDLYYDIAKLWHSLIVNQQIVKSELFKIENDEDDISLDIYRTLIDTDCEQVLKEWLLNKYNKNVLLHAELLTTIIFLNCSACHIFPYSKFLFNIGKLTLNKFYKKHKDKFWNKL